MSAVAPERRHLRHRAPPMGSPARVSRSAAAASPARSAIELVLFARRLGLGVRHDRHRLRPGQRVGPVLPARVAVGLPHRHAVDAALRRRPLRHHGAAVGDAHAARSWRCWSRSRSARSSRSTCPSSRRSRARDRQAVPRAARRRSRRSSTATSRCCSSRRSCRRIYPELPGFNMLAAGLVMGIMIIPYVSSISEDAMRAVPMSLREGSYAMGATRFQTAVTRGRAGGVLRHRRGLHPRRSRARSARR